MTRLSELNLWYGTILVGQIRDAFNSDATWHGAFQPQADSQSGSLARRLLEFIQFCQDWNDRVDANPQDPPDAAEFDSYADMLKCGLWRTQDALGQEKEIAEAPVFFSGGEVSWHTKDDA